MTNEFSNITIALRQALDANNIRFTDATDCDGMLKIERTRFVARGHRYSVIFGTMRTGETLTQAAYGAAMGKFEVMVDNIGDSCQTMTLRQLLSNIGIRSDFRHSCILDGCDFYRAVAYLSAKGGDSRG